MPEMPALAKKKKAPTKPVDPWSVARAHADNIRGGLKVTLCSIVALGLHLNKLKAELGYTHGGKRIGSSCQNDNLKPWSKLVAEKTGWSYEQCNRFCKLAEAVQSDLLSSRADSKKAAKALVTNLPLVWEQKDYETLADHLTNRFDATDIKGLMLETGLISPPKKPKQEGPEQYEFEFVAKLDAQACVAGPVLDLVTTMQNPESFARHLAEIPLDDTEADEEKNLPELKGLKTLSHALTQVQKQIQQAIKDRS